MTRRVRLSAAPASTVLVPSGGRVHAPALVDDDRRRALQCTFEWMPRSPTQCRAAPAARRCRLDAAQTCVPRRGFEDEARVRRMCGYVRTLRSRASCDAEPGCAVVRGGGCEPAEGAPGRKRRRGGGARAPRPAGARSAEPEPTVEPTVEEAEAALRAALHAALFDESVVDAIVDDVRVDPTAFLAYHRERGAFARALTAR